LENNKNNVGSKTMPEFTRKGIKRKSSYSLARESPAKTAKDEEQNWKSNLNSKADFGEDSEIIAGVSGCRNSDADGVKLSDVSVTSIDDISKDKPMPTDDSNETRHPGWLVDADVVDANPEETEENDATTTCYSVQEHSPESTTHEENYPQATDTITNTAYSTNAVQVCSLAEMS